MDLTVQRHSQPSRGRSADEPRSRTQQNEEGTTVHLAQNLLPKVVETSKRTGVMAHKALMWELECRHEECRCNCAACSSGLCVCARTAMRNLNEVLAESGNFFEEDGIYFYRPKQDSDAEGAGIKKGDVLLDVPGKEEGAHLQKSLQAALKKEIPTVPLVFRRISTGETEEITYPTYKKMRD